MTGAEPMRLTSGREAGLRAGRGGLLLSLAGFVGLAGLA